MRKFLFRVTVLTGLIGVGAVCFALYAWDDFHSPGRLAQEASVIFARGTGVTGIANQLAQAGVIDHPLLFKGITVALGDARKFKAGEYLFPPGIAPNEVMQMMAEGKVVVHKLTVAEGLKAREVAAILENEPLLTGEVPAIAEGSVLPQTYHFQRGDKRADILKRMQADMTEKLDTVWKHCNRNQPISNRDEMLTLASIVEKETGVKEERGHVASVFMNRLRLNMRLQSDPTVVYGMEKAMGAPLGRPLLSEDLRTETAYNTYMIAGLPPGPIANPGEASLQAVCNPPEGKDLYFVATGKGGHRFAPSLDEHNRNVAEYRRTMRE